MSKNTHMFVQNHNAPVKRWDTGNMVSKQTCQNTIISGLWNILRWDVLYNYNKHMAAINSMKECMESTRNLCVYFEAQTTDLTLRTLGHLSARSYERKLCKPTPLQVNIFTRGYFRKSCATVNIAEMLSKVQIFVSYIWKEKTTCPDNNSMQCENDYLMIICSNGNVHKAINPAVFLITQHSLRIDTITCRMQLCSLHLLSTKKIYSFSLCPENKWLENHFPPRTTRQRELVRNNGLVSLSWVPAVPAMYRLQ